MLMQNGKAQAAAPGAVLKFGPDLSTAHAIVTGFDPVAWAYVDLSTPGQDQRDLQRRQAVGALQAAGAPEAAVATVGSRIVAADVSPATLALFVSADGSLLYEQRIAPSELPDRAGFSTPAAIVPLLAWAQSRPPYVLVVIDRAGADLSFSAGGDRPVERVTVIGPDDEIERNAPGGWGGLTQGRYQHRAEDSWMHNAKRVAEEITVRTSQVGAQVLVVSGDVRAVQLLAERLPHDPALLVRHITGGRSLDGSQSTRATHVEQALREASAEQTRMVLDLFHSHLHPDGPAVEGAADTIAALAAGRVATLLVSESAPAPHTIWFGDIPTELYPNPDDARLAGRALGSGPLADVAVRSALKAGARVRVIPDGTPGGPAEGIGALCRSGS